MRTKRLACTRSRRDQVANGSLLPLNSALATENQSRLQHFVARDRNRRFGLDEFLKAAGNFRLDLENFAHACCPENLCITHSCKLETAQRFTRGIALGGYPAELRCGFNEEDSGKKRF